jgi:hypothetical protein
LYIFDTNVFYALGVVYKSAFPKLWQRIEELVESGDLVSVKEVRREIESNCPYPQITEWVASHKSIFKKPSPEEEIVVADLLKNPKYRLFVKKNNIVKGLPVADPFIIAAGKFSKGIVVTMESSTVGGAKIPAACDELHIKYINLEEFYARENLVF